jgi:hypothetical protein
MLERKEIGVTLAVWKKARLGARIGAFMGRSPAVEGKNPHCWFKNESKSAFKRRLFLVAAGWLCVYLFDRIIPDIHDFVNRG